MFQEEVGPVPGYLSLHQQGSKMMIKWTPNQLMQEEEACIQGKLTESNGVYRNESVPTENQNNTKYVFHANKKNQIFIILAICTKACNEWWITSPRLSAWATQL